MEENQVDLTEKIIAREKTIRNGRLKKQLYILSTAIPFIFVAMVSCLASLSPQRSVIVDMEEGYAASLTAAGIGGYVLTGVIILVFVAVVIILGVKLKKYKETK